jgi:hypothetical protein
MVWHPTVVIEESRLQIANEINWWDSRIQIVFRGLPL